jgi:hypothetical protein
MLDNPPQFSAIAMMAASVMFLHMDKEITSNPGQFSAMAITPASVTLEQ